MFLKQRALKLCRKNVDILITFEDVAKIDGPPFYQNQIDFWMWNAARLDYIFYRSFLI